MTTAATTLNAEMPDEFSALIAEIEAGAHRQIQLVRRLRRMTASDDEPPVDADLLALVDEFGDIAYLHAAAIEANGHITLAESRDIRRTLYGANVQGSAGLFGTKGSGSILYRDVPTGTKPADSQEVMLTEVGQRLADLWRERYPDAEPRPRSAPSDEWEQYRGRYGARMETFEAYVDVWTRLPEVRDHFKGWAIFSQCANAEPKRVSDSPARVALAESLMSDAGYVIGPPTERGARRWIEDPD